MSTHVLFSFVASNDVGDIEGLPDGPVLTVLGERKFDSVHLLFNEGMTPGKRTPYKEIVDHIMDLILSKGMLSKGSVRADRIVFEDVADHVDVYGKLRSFLLTTYPQDKWGDLEVTAAISSGTPAMQTAWILLAESGEFPLRLVRSLRAEHARSGNRVIDVPLQTGSLPKIERLRALEKVFALNERADYSIVEDPTTLTVSQRAIAQREDPVLIIGETGVGKEELAKTIHRESGLTGGFVAVNCGCMPEALMESEMFGHKRGSFTGALQDKKGLIESAAQGTLFLDEINSMPPSLQVKLLRFLDSGIIRRLGETNDRRVKVRVIAAGNKPLPALVSRGAFREDLFYRLCSFELFIPPLRERAARLEFLAKKYLEEVSKGSMTFGANGLDALTKYDFRGNVRELQIVTRRLAVTCAGKNQVGAQDVTMVLERMGFSSSAQLQIPESLHGKSLDLVSDILFEAALRQGGGVNAKAGKILGVSAPTVAKRRRHLVKR